MYYTYITASRSHTLYIGMSGQIETRMWQHKNGIFVGFSKKYNCDRLVYLEPHSEVQVAIAREKQLKGWTRAKKIALIEQDNPTLDDLSEAWGKPMKMYGET